ncbi:MAG: 16S rRNA (cytidine(1402)-2'-O)-methyltransferase [Chloroflexi bacterium]|nr:MAG: 16S rRNA (cytidine(1402)-2'-O)-methyltransferase [Chloroflexota bacterium]
MGTLYVVATPLGNLEDITLRALRVLKEVSLVAAEDTRSARRLLSHFDLHQTVVSYFEHNKLARLEQILTALEAGDVALISEAGTPLLSDPGYELVQAALARGFTVTPIPGPSALTAALSVSGLPTDRFLFLGFPPRRAGERRRWLEEVRHQPATLVLYESPHRLRKTLADLVEILGEDRPVAVCRELTKLHEEIWRGTLAAARQEWEQREPRGEFTLVIGGAPAGERWDAARVRAALAEALARGESTRDAARRIAQASGWSKKEVYALKNQ